MKTLLVSINKGGVGKSMISCQLARYAHGKGLRVLFVDLDDQGNSSNHLLRDQIAQPYSHSISKILCQYNTLSESEKELEFFSGTNGICLIQADAMLVSAVVEQSQAESDDYEGLKKGDIFLENISAFFEDVAEHFDLCIIDGAPTGDTRIVYAMCVANAVLSPIQLAQESIEGMGETLNGRRGVLRLQQSHNPELEFLGFLPNLVKLLPAQMATLEEVIKQYGDYMFRTQEGKACLIADSAAFKDCQSIGCSLASYAKTNSTARKNYSLIRPIFDLLLARLGLEDALLLAKTAADQLKAGLAEQAQS